MVNSTPPKREPGAPTRSAPALSHYIQDIEKWPERWMIDRPDQAIGRALLEVLEPFIHHLVEQGLSKRTFNRQIDNLWVLGGEIITKANSDPALREQSARVLILDSVDDEGGPLLSGGADPDDQESFDRTCRKLYGYLKSFA